MKRPQPSSRPSTSTDEDGFYEEKRRRSHVEQLESPKLESPSDVSQDTVRRRPKPTTSQHFSTRSSNSPTPPRPPPPRAPKPRNADEEPKYFGDEDHFHQGQRYTGEVIKWQPGKFGFLRSDETWKIFKADIFLFLGDVKDAGLEDLMENGLELEFTTRRGPKSVTAVDLRLVNKRQQPRESRRHSDSSRPKDGDYVQERQSRRESSRDNFHEGRSRRESSRDHFHEGKRRQESSRDNFHEGRSRRESSRDNFHQGKRRQESSRDNFHEGHSRRESRRDNFHEGQSRQESSRDNFHEGQSCRESSRDNFHEGQSRREWSRDTSHEGQRHRESSRDDFHEGQRHRESSGYSDNSKPKYFGDEDHFHKGQRYTGKVVNYRPGTWGFISSDDAWKVFNAEIFLLPKKVEEAGLTDVMEDGLVVEFTTMRGHKGVQATEISLPDNRRQRHEVRKESDGSKPRYFGDEDRFHQGQRYMGVVHGWRAGKFGFLHSDEAWQVFESEIFLLPTKVEEAGLDDVMEDGLEVEFSTMRGPKGVQATDLRIRDKRPRRQERRESHGSKSKYVGNVDERQPSTAPHPQPKVHDAKEEPRYFGDEDHFHQGQRYMGVVNGWREGKFGFIHSDEARKIFPADIYLWIGHVEDAGLVDVMENGLELEFTTMRGPKSVTATDLRLVNQKQKPRESWRDTDSSGQKPRESWRDTDSSGQKPRESRRDTDSSGPKYFGDEDHFHKGQRYRGEVTEWNSDRFFGFIRSDEAWEVFKADIFVLGAKVREAGLEDVFDTGLELNFATMRGPKGVMATDLYLGDKRQQHHDKQKESFDSRPRYVGDEDYFHKGQRYTGKVRNYRQGTWGFISSDDAWKVFNAEIFLLAKKVEEAGLEDVMEDGLEVEFTTMRGHKGVQADEISLVDNRKQHHDVSKEWGGSKPRYFGDEDHFHQGQKYTGVVRGWREGKFGFIHSDKAKEVFGSEVFLLPAKVEEAGLADVMEDGLEVEFTTMRGHKGVLATDITLADDSKQREEPTLADDSKQREEPNKEPDDLQPRYLGDEDHFHQGQRYMGVVHGWDAGKPKNGGKLALIQSDEASEVFDSDIFLSPAKVKEAGLEDVMEDGLEIEFATMRGREGVHATDLERVTW